MADRGGKRGKEGSVAGATVVARALKRQRVDFVFGVVGVPVVELAIALQSAGVHYVGMRNEQAVSTLAGDSPHPRLFLCVCLSGVTKPLVEAGDAACTL